VANAWSDAQIRFAELVAEHKAEWLLEQEDHVGGLRAEIERLLGQLERAYDALVAERQVLAGLRAFPEGGSLATIHGFGRGQGPSQAARAKAREDEANHVGLRKHGEVPRSTCSGTAARSGRY
jgi:hypothetical protein